MRNETLQIVAHPFKALRREQRGQARQPRLHALAVGVAVQQHPRSLLLRFADQCAQIILDIPLVTVGAVENNVLHIGNNRIFVAGIIITVSADTPVLLGNTAHGSVEISVSIPQKDKQFCLWLLFNYLFDSVGSSMGIRHYYYPHLSTSLPLVLLCYKIGRFSTLFPTFYNLFITTPIPHIHFPQCRQLFSTFII